MLQTNIWFKINFPLLSFLIAAMPIQLTFNQHKARASISGNSIFALSVTNDNKECPSSHSQQT
jgi:hypothetical protein